MFKRRPWTKADITYLREHRLKKTNTELGNVLGRSGNAITRKLCDLGLQRVQGFKPPPEPEPPTPGPWLDSDPELHAHRIGNVVASILHLVDLKRAGFRGGHGELRRVRG
jgi:hypothetical protein